MAGGEPAGAVRAAFCTIAVLRTIVVLRTIAVEPIPADSL